MPALRRFNPMLVSTVLPTALFVALVLAASLHGLAAGGHFPRTRRRPDLASGLGAAILLASIVLVLAGLAAGTIAALRLIPWYAAVIGGGAAILLAPPVLQWFTNRFVDGRAALVVFAIAAGAFAAVLAWLAMS